MGSGRVFVPQEPARPRASGGWEPIHDMRPALRFGRIEVLLDPGPVVLSTASTVREIRRRLADFCDDDYILPAGDPSLIAIVAVAAADANRGRFRILKWARREREYVEVAVDTRPSRTDWADAARGTEVS